MRMTGKIINGIRFDKRYLNDSHSFHSQTRQELSDFAETSQQIHRISMPLNLGKVVLSPGLLCIDYISPNHGDVIIKKALPSPINIR